MDKVEKWKRLDELALHDEIYMAHKKRYDEFAVKFGRFVQWCPPKVRNFLNGYADSGRLMMQRMSGIALENMEFKGE